MSFLEIARSRYTTKKYNPSAKISSEHIEQLKQIVRLSSSSINSQPWRIYFVSNERMKQELAQVSYFNQTKINQVSHLVVFTVLDDIENFERQIHQHLPAGSIQYYEQFVKPFPVAEIKSWLQHQVYLSLVFFLSACASLSIDSSPMEGIQSQKYNEILRLIGYKTLFAVAIGYRDPQDANQPSIQAKSRIPLAEIVHSI